jgi:hypothetical protein
MAVSTRYIRPQINQRFLGIGIQFTPCLLRKYILK